MVILEVFPTPRSASLVELALVRATGEAPKKVMMQPHAETWLTLETQDEMETFTPHMEQAARTALEALYRQRPFPAP